MSLKSKYHDFLRNPSTGVLAENASVTYIPSLTSVAEPTAILKHLAAQAKQVRKKNENLLSFIEGGRGVCLETETTLEFLTGGGAYLPGLDDNFLVDKVVTFPVVRTLASVRDRDTVTNALPQVHIVSFDAEQRITSIRLHWDQGSLLKQVDVIGSRGRGWPIRDGKEQARLVASVAGTVESSAAPSRRSTQSMAADEVPVSTRSHASSLTSQRGEPRTFSLFEGAAPSEEEPATSSGGPVISPRAIAKPPARGLEDILTGAEEEPARVPEFRPPSPRKQVNGGAPKAGAPKAGAGTNYHPIRLFDENDPPPSFKSPEKLKTDPRKYKHFEFGSGEDAQASSSPEHVKKSKHASQWDFTDFVTPEKSRAAIKIRTQDTRSFGWSDDEVWMSNLPLIPLPFFFDSPSEAGNVARAPTGCASPTTGRGNAFRVRR